MSFLVDTNVISELTRRMPNPGVLVWANTVSTISLSVISVEEIFFGRAWKPNERIRRWFESFLMQQCQLWPVTPDIARLASATIKSKNGTVTIGKL